MSILLLVLSLLPLHDLVWRTDCVSHVGIYKSFSEINSLNILFLRKQFSFLHVSHLISFWLKTILTKSSNWSVSLPFFSLTDRDYINLSILRDKVCQLQN